jgi:uncharacterized protein YkwD
MEITPYNHPAKTTFFSASLSSIQDYWAVSSLRSCPINRDIPKAARITKLGVKIAQGEIHMRVMIALTAFLMVEASAIVVAQGTSASAAEQQLFAEANRERKAHGLGELKWDDALASAARGHAGVMAQHGSAEHGFAGEPNLASRANKAGAHFVYLAENVVRGTSAEGIQAEFLKSARHRANILDTDMDSIGVGVVERGGQVFAVENFSKAK